MCTRSQLVLKKEDDVTEWCQNMAYTNCDEIMETLFEKDEMLDAYRKAFIAYIDAFQCRFKSAIDRRFHSQAQEEQEPWCTNYVTLKPWAPEEGKSTSSLVAKAHKITKKASCVLFNHEPSTESLHASNNLLIGSVDLYAKCIKESPIDWTRPEKAQEESTLKNVWQKSKLRLVMLSAGALIEVTHPKHSHKPLTAYFAHDIREVRSTSPLETPDDETNLNFVIRTGDNKEILIKAQSSAEKSSWILIIRRVCSYQETKEVTNNEDGSLNYDNFLEELRQIGNVKPPVLQESSSTDLRGHSTASSSPFHDQETNQFLAQYPWYHGSISRSESANLVLHQHARHILAESGATETFQTHAPNGSGVFLLRISGTRQGEYVLTYNFHQRAKHMKFQVSSDGQCRANGTWFSSVFDFLENYRSIEVLPLESGGGSDIRLTSFVVNDDSSNSAEVMTYNGSVRIRTDLLNIGQNGHQSSSGQQRAKENSYSFI